MVCLCGHMKYLHRCSGLSWLDCLACPCEKYKIAEKEVIKDGIIQQRRGGNKHERIEKKFTGRR